MKLNYIILKIIIRLYYSHKILLILNIFDTTPRFSMLCTGPAVSVVIVSSCFADWSKRRHVTVSIIE